MVHHIPLHAVQLRLFFNQLLERIDSFELDFIDRCPQAALDFTVAFGAPQHPANFGRLVLPLFRGSVIRSIDSLDDANE